MEDIKEFPVCRRCGRKLRSAEARQVGYGKICLHKSQTNSNKQPLFRKELK